MLYSDITTHTILQHKVTLHYIILTCTVFYCTITHVLYSIVRIWYNNTCTVFYYIKLPCQVCHEELVRESSRVVEARAWSKHTR